MLGSSSGFSLFSPQGLQWISKRTGSAELPHFIKSVIKSLKKGGKRNKVFKANEKADLWSPIPQSSREPPPPKHLADQWIQCEFSAFDTSL
jgi:hypothetical protein